MMNATLKRTTRRASLLRKLPTIGSTLTTMMSSIALIAEPYVSNSNPSQQDVMNMQMAARQAQQDGDSARAMHLNFQAQEMNNRRRQNEEEGCWRQSSANLQRTPVTHNYNDFKKQLKRGVPGEPSPQNFIKQSEFVAAYIEFYIIRYNVADSDNYTRTKLQKHANQIWYAAHYCGDASSYF